MYPGNFVNLSLPKNKRWDEITNVGLKNGVDPNNGNQVTKQDNNRSKVRQQVRTVVKEVKTETNETPKAGE